MFSCFRDPFSLGVFLKTVLDSKAVARAVDDLAGAVAAAWKALPAEAPSPAVVGILRRGAPLAQRLRARLEKLLGRDLAYGELDITLYRDDLDLRPMKPVVRGTDLAFDLTDRHVLLVDDVLYSGRTIRAALQELSDFGRPAGIQLAVLVDRGLRQLPIQADFAGLTLKTGVRDWVEVRLSEVDGHDAVEIGSKE